MPTTNTTNQPPELTDDASSYKDAARLAAQKANDSIITDSVGLEEALTVTRSRLKDPRDRAFHRILVMTVLRHYGEINAVLDHFLERRPRGKAARVVTILQLGIAQVLYLDVPDYAAATTTVDLVRESGHSGHDKLANAIMRRVVEQGRNLLKNMDKAKLNTPWWLWDTWEASYGSETCRAIAKANMQEPKLDITAKGAAEEWAEKLQGELLPTDTIRLDSGGMIENLAGFEEGAWWIQDAAAALPVRLLGDISGKHIADLCAAPGGKTMQLIAGGATVTAVDRSKKRLKILHRNLYRTHMKAKVITADADQWRPDELLDGVLLDAPCSATGTLRRHPDIAFHKTAEDITSLTTLQDTLLDAAVEMVKPGGLIVYCTCSLQREEGEDRIAAALTRGLPLEIVPVTKAELPGLEDAITLEGSIRTMPWHWEDKGGMDGFYAIRLRRKS